MEINSNLFFLVHTNQILVTCLFLIVVFYIPAVESKKQGVLSQKTIFYFSLISHLMAFFVGFLRTVNLENSHVTSKKNLWGPRASLALWYAMLSGILKTEEKMSVKIWRKSGTTWGIIPGLASGWEPWWSLLSPKDRVVKHPFFKWRFCWRKKWGVLTTY